MLLLFVILLFFIGYYFQGKPTNSDLIASAEDSIYIENIEALQKDLEVEVCRYQSPLRLLKDGVSIVASEAQSDVLIQENTDYEFIPHYKQTVVIAIDRTKTNEEIETFRDLLKTNEEINFDLGQEIDESMWEYPKSHQIFISMAYGLYGDYDLDSLGSAIKSIADEDRFFTDDMGKPIIVTYDSIAVQMNKQGRALEIVVPKDGTLSLSYGVLLYKDSIRFHEKLEDELVKSGYRLVDNTADQGYYPSEENYHISHEVTDFDRYNEAARMVSKTIMQQSFETKEYSFVNSKENTAFYLFLLFVIIIYTISLTHRMTDEKILKSVMIGFILLVLFITLAVLKSISNENNDLEIAVWYSYYIPILLMPASLVYITFYSSHPKKKKLFLNIYKGYLAISILLLGFVMTNNKHGMVFHVYIQSDFTYSYEYNTGYYYLIGWVLVSLVVALGTLVYKGFTSPKKMAFIYPVILNIVLVFYIIAYICGVEIIRQFELAFGNAIILLFYVEACMRSRIFPSNKGYEKFFFNSSLAMKITDKSGNVAKNSRVIMNIDQNFILKETPIIGGKFSYYEDYSSLNSALDKISKINEELRQNNDFLLQKGSVNANLAALMAEETVYENIDRVLIAGIDKVKKQIETLKKNSKDKKALEVINLLICMIKRECMFRINVLYQKYQQAGIFVSAIHEIKGYTASINLNISVLCTYVGDLKTIDILSMYRFLVELVEQTIAQGCENMVVQMYETPTTITFSVIPDQVIFGHEIEKQFKGFTNFILEVRPWESSEAYLLHFKKEKDINE